MNNVIVKSYIEEIIKMFRIQGKFNKQVEKIKNGTFDKWLGFEKIEVADGIILYSFRIDIHFRAYVRKENGDFIVFDVNNHDYKTIVKKLKSR